MPFFTSPVDLASLFYRYYQPDKTAFRPMARPTSDITLVFLHGWPMSSRMFEELLVPFCETYRFRCIAPDRRGFGRSEWSTPRTGSIAYDVFVADLVALLQHVDVHNFVLIGASMGSAEGVLAYLGSPFVRERCKGFVWIGPNMPAPLQSPQYPLSLPAEAWDALLDASRADKSNFISESLPGIFVVEGGPKVSNKMLERFECIVTEADPIAFEKTAVIIQRNMEKELRELAAMENKIPIMVLHGDSDAGSPLEASSQILKTILPWIDLKVYGKAAHGLYATHSSQAIQDILGFVKGLLKT